MMETQGLDTIPDPPFLPFMRSIHLIPGTTIGLCQLRCPIALHSTISAFHRGLWPGCGR